MGAFSPVNHYGLYQGWKRKAAHLLLVALRTIKSRNFNHFIFRRDSYNISHEKQQQLSVKTLHTDRTNIRADNIFYVLLWIQNKSRLNRTGHWQRRQQQMTGRAVSWVSLKKEEEKKNTIISSSHRPEMTLCGWIWGWGWHLVMLWGSFSVWD